VDAPSALGGRDRILAAKTLVVQGGGHDLNVGQSLRYDELGLQSDVWQIRDYKRIYDLANGRARFEVLRASQYPYYQGIGGERQVQAIDGNIAFNIAQNGNAVRVFGAQAAVRRVEYLRHPLTLVRAALEPSCEAVERPLAGQRTSGGHHDWWRDTDARNQQRDEAPRADCPDRGSPTMGNTVMEARFGE
jgi:hypothetical protein